MTPRHLALALFVLAGALLAAVSAAPAVRAEHEPDHRYYLVGTVTDELGQPLCGLTVRVSDIDAPSSLDTNRTGVTDGAGRYIVQLHLHSAVVEPVNNNVGDTILVVVEGTDAAETTTADPNAVNPEGWGQKTVDLSVLGGKSTCPNLLLWIGAGVGVTLGVIAAVWYVRRPRRGGRGGRVSREVLALPGVTRTRVRELEKSGIRTLDELANSDPNDLAAKTNLSAKQARLLVKRAKEGVRSKDA